ncbi:cytoplasmic dynein 2 intermediate chain 1 isoform X1 [Lampetra fluviatilis]
MASREKRTKEDTWKSEDLKNQLKQGVHADMKEAEEAERRRRREQRRQAEEGRGEERVRGERDGERRRPGETAGDKSRDKRRERDEDPARHSNRERLKEGEQEKGKDRRERQEQRERHDRVEDKPKRDKEKERRREREQEADGATVGIHERRDKRDRDAGKEERVKERERGQDGEKEKRRDKERMLGGDRDADRHRSSRKEEETLTKKDEGSRRERGKGALDGYQVSDREVREKDRERHRNHETHRDRDVERDGGKLADRERHKDKERDREKRRERDRDKEREMDTRRDKEGDKERDKERDRHREREKYRDREGHRDRDKERDAERNRDKDRDKHTERDRDKRSVSEKDKERDKERDRERHKERDRDKGRERERKEGRDRDVERDRDDHTRRAENGDKRRVRYAEAEGSAGRRHRDSTATTGGGGGSALGADSTGLVRPSQPGAAGAIRPSSPQDDAAAEYEDDFEDYDDDFEDEEGSAEEKVVEVKASREVSEGHPGSNRELEAVRRAIAAENERVASWSPRDEVPPAAAEPQSARASRSGSGKTFIDFTGAGERTATRKVVAKQRKRGLEVLRMIQLDTVTFDLLDMPPVSEYDAYISAYGRSNTKQAYVQCGEDNVEREVQTEEIETEEKWSQHPGEGPTVCAGPADDARGGVGTREEQQLDAQRLQRFLASAFQVVSVLLEEEWTEKEASRNLETRTSSLSVGSSFYPLHTDLPFLHGRTVSRLHVSEVQRHMLLSVHPPGPSGAQVDAVLTRCVVLCVWDLRQPSQPQRVLLSEPEVSCCCFGLDRAGLLFAGTEAGGLLLWDPREPPALHRALRDDGEHVWPLRLPTYSTVGAASGTGHSTPVRAVEPVPTPSVPLSARSPTERSGLSYQLASLEEGGVMNLWVVLEMPTADAAGSLSDLGLMPGGRVKLLHSSRIQLHPTLFGKNRAPVVQPVTLGLHFLPCDPAHYLIITDTAYVLRCARPGYRSSTRCYHPSPGAGCPLSRHASTCSISPFELPLFLMGSGDGGIRLHSLGHEEPLESWPVEQEGLAESRAPRAVQWSLSRPAVFFVLDGAGQVRSWDLLRSRGGALSVEKPTRGVVAMAAFGDPEKPGLPSGLVLAKEGGAVEVHQLSSKLSTPDEDEVSRLETLLHQPAA